MSLYSVFRSLANAVRLKAIALFFHLPIFVPKKIVEEFAAVYDIKVTGENYQLLLFWAIEVNQSKLIELVDENYQAIKELGLLPSFANSALERGQEEVVGHFAAKEKLEEFSVAYGIEVTRENYLFLHSWVVEVDQSKLIELVDENYQAIKELGLLPSFANSALERGQEEVVEYLTAKLLLSIWN